MYYTKKPLLSLPLVFRYSVLINFITVLVILVPLKYWVLQSYRETLFPMNILTIIFYFYLEIWSFIPNKIGNP